MAIIHFSVVLLMGSIKTLKHHQYQCLLVGESRVSTTNNIIININILHDQQQAIVFHPPTLLSIQCLEQVSHSSSPSPSLSVTTM